MANPHRGEASFEVEGKTYRLRFSWNAAAEFEEPAGRSFYDAADTLAVGRLSVRTLRAMLWAGLQEHHPGLTLREAGVLIEKIGQIEAWTLVRKAIEYFFPTAEAEKAPDPPEPAASQ
jgi:hypothetical protein